VGAPAQAAPRAAFVISHSIYVPGSPGEVDLALPAAAFTEVDGSVVNGERRVLRLRRVVEPPGEALPDWEILCRIARAIGARGFDFASARDVHDEIASLVEGFGDFEHPGEVAVPFRCGGVAAPPRVRAAAAGGPKLPYTLTISHTEHAYRGTTLASRVGGASRLFAEGVLAINPEDAEAAGISGDDRVVVTGAHFERTWTALTVPTQPRGVLGVTLAPGDLLGVNPGGVRVRRQDA
jgi:anaerobic selenocysteine-containing dehydrogenase